MKLKKLIINNIRSYEHQEIIFPDGSLLLSGDIGSGKTSILLAIEYAIFGLQPGQKGSSLLRNQADSGEVILELLISENNVTIERKLKRSGSSIVSEYSAITVNGEKFELSSTEIKTKILSLLGYPQEFVKRMNILYRYTVYTPQEQMKQIILENPETRLNIIRHIFGMDKYKRIKENISLSLIYLKEKSKELQGEIKGLDEDKTALSVLQARIKNIERNISLQGKIFFSLLEKRKLIENEVKEIEIKLKEREKFEKEVEKTKILSLTKQDSLVTIDAEISSINQQISDFNLKFKVENYSETVKNLFLISNELDDLNAIMLDLTSQERALENSRKDYSERKERFFDISFCPTCLQNVPPAHKHNVLNESETKLSEIRAKLAEISKMRNDLEQALIKKKSDKSGIEKQKMELEILQSKVKDIEKLSIRIEEYKKQRIFLEKDIELLAKHLSGLKEQISVYSKFEQMFSSKQKELKQAFLEEKNTEISLAEANKEIQMTKNEISNLEKLISSREESKKKLSETSDMIYWLSSQFISFVDYIERNVLMKLRIEFSRLFSKWFHMLAGSDFEVQLDESFTPLMMSYGTEMEYQFLSGGERTSVALAYRLALNQTINSLMSQINTKDIVMLDEPTDGFSETQIDKIKDVLNELNVSQLIIVSHEQKIEEFVNNIIKLKKEDSKSEIVADSKT